MSWLLAPCLPEVAPSFAWVAVCDLTEGYDDKEHSHWLDVDTWREFVTVHLGDGPRKSPDETKSHERRIAK